MSVVPVDSSRRLTQNQTNDFQRDMDVYTVNNTVKAENGTSNFGSEEVDVVLRPTTEATDNSWRPKMKSVIFDGDNLLLILTMIGVTLGAILGFTLRLAHLSDTAVLLISFPGELLMNMLKCVILPMIIASILSSLVELDTSTSGRMGMFTLGYYLCTTTCAVLISLFVVMIIRPGDIARNSMGGKFNPGIVNSTKEAKSTLDMGLDFFRRLVPENIFRALIYEVTTEHEFNMELNRTTRQLVYADNPNILGIVSFSIVFGLAVAALPKEGKAVAKLFVSLNTIINKLVVTLMWALPLGVISLVAGSILELEADLGNLLTSMGVFVGTSMLALTIHFFMALPLFYFLIVRKNPYTFLKNQFAAYANTLGHSSSSAALPITSHCLEAKNHVDGRVSQFCLPVGAAVNIDGAALYEGLATVFCAQMNGMHLGWGQALAVILTVTMSSVGSSGLPGAGLVSVLPLISPIPVSNANVAMLIVTDWFVDRYRTANNVMGDSLGAGIVYRLCKTQLQASDQHRPSLVQ